MVIAGDVAHRLAGEGASALIEIKIVAHICDVRCTVGYQQIQIAIIVEVTPGMAFRCPFIGGKWRGEDPFECARAVIDLQGIGVSHIGNK